tara:strand:- start:217 stop:1539 length:1323 start_codon:yes stop_codon:yes gene_type:complete
MSNLEAERAVVSAILVNPLVIDDIVEILEPSDFTDMQYGLIYGTLKSIDAKDIDIITLAEKLAQKGILEQIGGMQFLSDIHSYMHTSSNAKTYAKLIKELSLIKSLKFKLNDALKTVETSLSYQDSVAQVSSILSEVEVKTESYKTFKEIVRGEVMSLDERFRNGGGFTGLKTGFESLDETLMGLNGGDYFVIGARPSMGKTAFSLALCKNMARSDGDILYFSAESTKESLANRIITAASNVNSKTIKTARLNNDEWVRYHAGVTSIMDLPLHIIDIAGIDILHAKAIANKFNRKKKIKAIFVDYIQLMTCKNSKNDFEAVSSISRGLKAMAKENNCPVIALAQLSRGVEQRPDKRPVMSDLRSTGQIEQDADFISFLYRDEYYNDDSYDKGITELSIKKNREGETGKHFFQSDFSTMTYKEISYTEQPKKETYKPFSGN